MALRRLGRARDVGFRARLAHQPSAPVLLLSPHLDDAALACWSVLAGPGELSVVTVFAGTPAPGAATAWDAIVGARDAAALMRERIEEDRAALAMAGRASQNLGFTEFQYRRQRPEPSLRALDSAIRRVAGAASRLLAPMTLGTVHPDHRLVRRYALAVHATGMPVSLYADVPYATVYGWPAWVTATAAREHLDVDAYWAASLAGVSGRGDPRVVRLDEAAADAKLAALRRYRTQFPSLDRGPIGQIANPLVHPFEVFWDLR